MRRTPILAVAIGTLTVSMAVVAPSALAASAPVTSAPAGTTNTSAEVQYSSSTQKLTDLGSVTLADIVGTPTSPPTGTSSHAKPSATPLGRPPSATLNGKGRPISAGSFSVQTGNVAGEQGFNGISGPQQAAVNGYDLEPPDQGSCVGPGANGQPVVMEIVNNALAAYTPSGTQVLGVKPTTALFNQVLGTSLSDPRCYYDAPTHRWFFTEFTYGLTSTQYVAVSQSADPLGTYEVFGIDTTDGTNTANGCPCFGDFDQIGADANGFYITTNEFSVNGPNFNGTVMYALSKQGLEAAATGGTLPPVVRYAITSDRFTVGTWNGPYHISPASTPPGGTFAPNTEYFVESNSNALSGTDNHLIVYALTGTDALATGGTPQLVATRIGSEQYAFPPNATQPDGPIPYGSSKGATAPGTIQADFNAVQEVTYTGGKLYAELDTAAGNPNAPTPPTDAVAWFTLTPTLTSSGVTAQVVKQGYVANSQNLLYPHLTLDAKGNGFLNFSVSGSANYPSAAYVAFHANAGPTGTIHVAAAGTAPEDGFTCYLANYGGCRWGDYSGGAVWNGRAYMMTEYIPATARDTHTNWGTYVWSAPVH
jgi:hypothetical protein